MAGIKIAGGVGSLFLETMGGGDGLDPAVAVPKFRRLAAAADAYLAALDAATAAFDAAGDLEAVVACGDAAEAYREAAAAEFGGWPGEPADFAGPRRLAFAPAYEAAKTGRAVSACMAAHNYIIRQKRAIEASAAEGAPDPLARVPGRYEPHAPGADLRRLGAAAAPVLRATLAACEAMYAAVSAPDADMGRLAEALRPTLADLRKCVPGCEDAFRMMEKSFDRLSENYGSYYREYVASGNPSEMFTAFIADTSRSGGKVKPSIMAQFNKITAYYRKAQASAPRDSRFDDIFGTISEVQRKAEEARAAAAAEPEPEDPAAAAAAAEAAAARREHDAAPSEVAGLTNAEADFLPAALRRPPRRGRGGKRA